MPAPSRKIELREDEVELIAIRAQGAGGQNVNKVSNALHLRFDIGASSLPDELKTRLLERRDQRISADGVVVIKAPADRRQGQARCSQTAAGVGQRNAMREVRRMCMVGHEAGGWL